jgi:hypothetical protein
MKDRMKEATFIENCELRKRVPVGENMMEIRVITLSDIRKFSQANLREGREREGWCSVAFTIQKDGLKVLSDRWNPLNVFATPSNHQLRRGRGGGGGGRSSGRVRDVSALL